MPNPFKLNTPKILKADIRRNSDSLKKSLDEMKEIIQKRDFKSKSNGNQVLLDLTANTEVIDMIRDEKSMEFKQNFAVLKINRRERKSKIANRGG